MPITAKRSLDGRLYRATLALCPASFLREHGDEMVRDFDEARAEAVAAGERALWILRLLIAVDLVRTAGVQWLRTGLPLIGLTAILVPLAFAEALATLARRATIPMPLDADREEILGVLLLAVIAVVLIAMTIVLSLWVGRLTRRGPK
jgi:hypothetical protein